MTRAPLLVAALALALAVPANAGSGTTVRAVDNRFQPATVTVAPGTLVTWANAGTSAHEVTGDGFASGNLDPGKAYSWMPPRAGTYAYVCRYHASAGMKGTVVVRAAAATSGLPKTGGDRIALGLLLVGAAAVAGGALRYGWRTR
jgi:LPXTG-motif cell wall-anchored protein